MIKVKFTRSIRKARAKEIDVPTEEWLARFGGKGSYHTYGLIGAKPFVVLSHIEFENELDALAFKLKFGV